MRRSNKSYTKQCCMCGTTFVTTDNRKLYCSAKCKGQSAKLRVNVPIISDDPCACSRVKTCAYSKDLGTCRCCAYILYTGTSRVLEDMKNGYSGYPEDCPHYTTDKSVRKRYKEIDDE